MSSVVTNNRNIQKDEKCLKSLKKLCEQSGKKQNKCIKTIPGYVKFCKCPHPPVSKKLRVFGNVTQILLFFPSPSIIIVNVVIYIYIKIK